MNFTIVHIIVKDIHENLQIYINILKLNHVNITSYKLHKGNQKQIHFMIPFLEAYISTLSHF